MAIKELNKRLLASTASNMDICDHSSILGENITWYMIIRYHLNIKMGKFRRVKINGNDSCSNVFFFYYISLYSKSSGMNAEKWNDIEMNAMSF